MKFISRAKRKALEEKLAALEQDSAEAKALRDQLGWGEPAAPQPAPAQTAPAPKAAPAAKKPSAKAKVVAAAKKAFNPKKKSNKN